MNYGPETYWDKLRYAFWQKDRAEENQNQMELINASNQDSTSEDDSSSDKYERGYNRFPAILDHQVDKEKFLALKRNVSGLALSKNTGTGQFEPIREEDLLISIEQARNKGSSQKKRASIRKVSSKKSTSWCKTLQRELQKKYDVVNALSNASLKLYFRKLWQGKEFFTRKELGWILK